MTTRNHIFVFICICASVALAAEPEQRAAIPVVVNPDVDAVDRKPGIEVHAPTKISASAKDPLRYSYRLHNTLPYDVFVEVSTADTAALTLESEEGAKAGGPMSVVLFDEGALRRLQAAIHREGQPPFVCCCCTTTATIDIGPIDDKPLEKFVGWKGTLEFSVNGYRRSDGGAFSESIEVPVEIVK